MKYSIEALQSFRMWLKRSGFSSAQKATFPFWDCIGCFTNALVLTWSYYRVSCLQHTNLEHVLCDLLGFWLCNEPFNLISTTVIPVMCSDVHTSFFSEISFAPAVVFPPQTTWHLRVDIRLWNCTETQLLSPSTLLHMALYNKLCLT